MTKTRQEKQTNTAENMKEQKQTHTAENMKQQKQNAHIKKGK